MTAYSFKKRFAEPILAGIKAQTICADRKRHARPGEEIQLYTGMRTKQCKLIGRSTCFEVQPIQLVLYGRGAVVVNEGNGNHTHYIDSALNEFARDDGFKDWDEMKGFWHDEHDAADEFTGMLIRWRPLGGNALWTPTTADIDEID